MQSQYRSRTAVKTEFESWFSVPKGLIKAIFVIVVTMTLVEKVAAHGLGTGKYHVAKNAIAGFVEVGNTITLRGSSLSLYVPKLDENSLVPATRNICIASPEAVTADISWVARLPTLWEYIGLPVRVRRKGDIDEADEYAFFLARSRNKLQHSINGNTRSGNNYFEEPVERSFGGDSGYYLQRAVNSVLSWLGRTEQVFETAVCRNWTKPVVAQPDRCHKLWMDAQLTVRNTKSSKVKKAFQDIITKLEMTAGLQALIPLRAGVTASVCGPAAPMSINSEDEQAYWRGEYESSTLFRASKVFEECALYKFSILAMGNRALKTFFAVQENIASLRLPVAYVRQLYNGDDVVHDRFGTVIYCGSKAHVLSCYLKDKKDFLAARDCVDMVHRVNFPDVGGVVAGVSIGLVEIADFVEGSDEIKNQLTLARSRLYEKILTSAEECIMEVDEGYDFEMHRKVTSEELIACCYSENKTGNGLYNMVTRSETANKFIVDMVSKYMSTSDMVLALWAGGLSMRSTSWEPDNYVRYAHVAVTNRVSSSAILAAADKTSIFNDGAKIVTVTPIGYSSSSKSVNMHHSNLRFSQKQLEVYKSFTGEEFWTENSVYAYQFFPYLTANLWLVIEFSAQGAPSARLVETAMSMPICKNSAHQIMRAHRSKVMFTMIEAYVESVTLGGEEYLPDFDRRMEKFCDRNGDPPDYDELSPIQASIYDAVHCEMFHSQRAQVNTATKVTAIPLNLDSFMHCAGVPGYLASDGGCIDGQIGSSIEFEPESTPFESKFWGRKSEVLTTKESRELEYLFCTQPDGTNPSIRQVLSELKHRHEVFEPFATAPELDVVLNPDVSEKKLMEGGNVHPNPGPMNVEIVGYKRGRSMISLEIDSDEQEDGPLRIVTTDRVSIAQQRFQWASILSGMATILGAAGVAVGQTNYSKLAQCGDIEPNPGPTQTPTGRWRGCVPIQPQSDTSASVALVYKIDTEKWLGQSQIVGSLTEPNVPAKTRQSIKVTAFQLGVYNSGTVSADTVTRGAVMVGYLSAFMTYEDLAVSNSTSYSDRVPTHLARFRRISDGQYVDGQGQNPFRSITTSTIYSERQFLVKYEQRLGGGYCTVGDEANPNKSEDGAIDAYTHTWNGMICQDRYMANEMIALDEKRWTVQSSNSNNSFHVDGDPLTIEIDADVVTEVLKYRPYRYVYVSVGISASSLVQTTTTAYNYFQDFFVTVVPRRDFIGIGVSGSAISTVETVITQKAGTKFNVTTDPVSVSGSVSVSSGTVSISGNVSVEQKPGTKMLVTADPIEQKSGSKFLVTADPIEQKSGAKFNVTADPIEQKSGSKFNVTADPIEQKAGAKFAVTADPIEQKAGSKFDVSANPVVVTVPSPVFVTNQLNTSLNVSVTNTPEVTVSDMAATFPLPVTIMNTALNPVQTFDLSDTIISVAEGVVIPVVLSEDVGIKIRTDEPIQVTFPTPQPVIIDSASEPIPIYAEDELPVGGTVAAVLTGPGRLEPLWVSDTQVKRQEFTQIDYIAEHNGATNFSLLLQSGNVEPNPGPVVRGDRITLKATGTDNSAYTENIDAIANLAAKMREAEEIDQAFRRTMHDEDCRNFLLAVEQGKINFPYVECDIEILRRQEVDLVQSKTDTRLRTNDITNPRVPDDLMPEEKKEDVVVPGDGEGSKKPGKTRKAKISKQQKFAIVTKRVGNRLMKLSDSDFVAWLLYSQATIGWKTLMLAVRINYSKTRTLNFRIRGEDWTKDVEMGIIELRSAMVIASISDQNEKFAAVNQFPMDTPLMTKLIDPFDFGTKRKTAYAWSLTDSNDKISKLSFPSGSASEIDIREKVRLVSAPTSAYDYHMKSYLNAGNVLSTEPINEAELSSALLGTFVPGEGQTNFSLLMLCGDVERDPGPAIEKVTNGGQTNFALLIRCGDVELDPGPVNFKAQSHGQTNFSLLKLAGDVESNPGPTWAMSASDDIDSDATVAEIADNFEAAANVQNEGRFPVQLFDVHVLNDASARTTQAKFSVMARITDYTSPMTDWSLNVANDNLENQFTSWPIKSLKRQLEEVSLAKLNSFFTIETPASMSAVTARVNEINRVLGAYTRQIAEILAKSKGVYNPTRQAMRLMKYYLDMLVVSEAGREECYKDNAEWGAPLNRDYGTAANVRADMLAAPFNSGVRYAAAVANGGPVWPAPGNNPDVPQYDTPNIDDNIGPYFELGRSKLAAAVGLVRVAAASVADQFDVYEPQSIDPTNFIFDTQLIAAQAAGAAGAPPVAVPGAARPVQLNQPTYSWGGISPIRGAEPTWNMMFTTVPSDVIESLQFRNVKVVILPLWLADTTLNGLQEAERAMYLSMYIAMFYPRLGRAMIKFTPTTVAGAAGLRKHLITERFDEEYPESAVSTLYVVPVTANQADGNYYQTSSLSSLLYYGSTVRGVSHGQHVPGQALPPPVAFAEIAAQTRMRLSTGGQIHMHDAASYLASWIPLWTPARLYAFMKLQQMKFLFHEDVFSEMVDMLAYTHVKFPLVKSADGNYGNIPDNGDWRGQGNNEGYVLPGFNTSPDATNSVLVDFTQGTLYDTRLDPRGASELVVSAGTDTITSLVLAGWAAVSTDKLKSFSDMFGRESVMSPGQPVNFIRYLKMHATVARARYGYHIAATGLPRIVWNQSKKTAWDLNYTAAPANENTAISAIADFQELGNELYAEYSGSEVVLGILPTMTSGFGKLLNEATFPAKVTRPRIVSNSRQVRVLAAGANPAQQNAVRYNLGLGANYNASALRVGFEFVPAAPAVNWLPFPLFVYAKFCKHSFDLPGAIGQARCAGLGVDLQQLRIVRNSHSRNRFKVSDIHSDDEYIPKFKVSVFDLVKAYAALFDIATQGNSFGQSVQAMLADGSLNSGVNTSQGNLSTWVQPVALKTAFNDNAVGGGAISGALINTANSRVMPIMAIDGYATWLTLTEVMITGLIPNFIAYQLSSRVERGFTVGLPKVFTSQYITTSKSVDLKARFVKDKAPAAAIKEEEKNTKSQNTPGDDERQTLGNGASQEGGDQ